MGVRGEPSKTGVQSTLFIVPPNCAALVRGTGDFVSPQRCVFIVPPDSTSFRRSTKRFICHAKRGGVQSALLLVRLLPSLKLWRDKQLRKLACRTGGIVSPQRGVLIVRLPPSLKLWRDKQLRKLACRTGGFCFTGIVRQTNGVQLRHTNKSAIVAVCGLIPVQIFKLCPLDVAAEDFFQAGTEGVQPFQTDAASV